VKLILNLPIGTGGRTRMSLIDRIAFFASEMPSGNARFTAYMRMEMPGKFNVNPVNMEGMYTNKVHARSKAQLIKVVE